MKWSDMTYDDFYIPYDENQKSIRGFFLTTLNVDLNHISPIFNEHFSFCKSASEIDSRYIAKKVPLTSIIGTSHQDYGDKSIIQAYMRIKRAAEYIRQGRVTRGKYFYMLKSSLHCQKIPVILSYNADGDYYWVDGSGNHRIILYKMMMLAEIAEKYEWARSDSYDVSYMGFHDVRKKYWLNALVRMN